MFDTQVPLYGIFIIISFICGLFVVYVNAKRYNFRVEEIISLLIFVILGAIFGAKYYTFLANPKEFNGIFNFEKVGLSSYGAVIGIIISLICYFVNKLQIPGRSRAYKMPSLAELATYMGVSGEDADRVSNQIFGGSLGAHDARHDTVKMYMALQKAREIYPQFEKLILENL